MGRTYQEGERKQISITKAVDHPAFRIGLGHGYREGTPFLEFATNNEQFRYEWGRMCGVFLRSNGYVLPKIAKDKRTTIRLVGVMQAAIKQGYILG